MTDSPKAGCAVCGRPIEPKFRPFCSARCADVDLGRWLQGRYAIPGAPSEDLDAELDDEV